MKAYRQNKGWRMIHARLCEMVRQAVFSASPRQFLDCESETSKHLSASERHLAKIRAPFLVENQKEFVQAFSQLLRTGWNRKFGYQLGVIFFRKFVSSFCNIFKTSARVSSGFHTRETFEITRPQVEWFYCFRAFKQRMKPEARVFEVTSRTMKISLNYHFNKFSQQRSARVTS